MYFTIDTIFPGSLSLSIIFSLEIVLVDNVIGLSKIPTDSSALLDLSKFVIRVVILLLLLLVDDDEVDEVDDELEMFDEKFLSI